MGFLFSPSCVAAYKLTGNKEGREAAIKAAEQLISRYHPVGEFIQAWGAMDEPGNYRLIIDCLLNLPRTGLCTGNNKLLIFVRNFIKLPDEPFTGKDAETRAQKKITRYDIIIFSILILAFSW